MQAFEFAMLWSWEVCSYDRDMEISLNHDAIIEFKDVESLLLWLISQTVRCAENKQTVDFLQSVLLFDY